MQNRRLAAIMFTDIVGYTALMGRDEEKAFNLLQNNTNLHNSLINQFNGNLIKEIGDGILASFETNADAVRCGIAIQQAVKKEGYKLRIGIHEGDLIFKDADVWGDGVNIAARLQELAMPGDILISEAVNKDIRNKADISAKKLGKKALKNVLIPIEVFRVNFEDKTFKDSKVDEISKERRITVKWTYPIIIGLVIIISGVLLWYNWPKDEISNLEKSIAVLPFKNLSNNPEKQYLADGMMDAILNHLQKIRELEVRSRTSVEQFRDPQQSLPEIAKKLKVNYIIEGSFQMVGEEANLIVQLLIAPEDKHVWSKEYTRNWSDIFSVQSEVAQSIASELQMVLSDEEEDRINRKPTDNLTAYDYYLRGKENNVRYFFSQDEQDFSNAISLFRHVLDLDPGFIQVYAEMSWTFWWRYFFGERSDRYNYLDSAIEFCDKALSLDPNLSDGFALSGLYNIITGNPEKALDDLNRAKYLSPNDPRVYRFLGLLFHSELDYKKAIENYLKAENLEHSSYEILILKGKMIELFLAIGANIEAESYIEEFMILEPNNYLGYMMYGWLASVQGNFEKALEAYQNGLIQSQDHPYFLRKLGETYAFLKRFSESKEYWIKLESMKEETETDLGFYDYRYAYTLWMMDEKEKALQLFEDYITYYKEYIESNSFRKISGVYYSLAGIYAFLGNREEAFKWLRKQEEVGFVIDDSIIGSYTYDDFILYDPLFDNIRDEEEFKKIVEQAQAKKAQIRAEVREIINSSDI